MRSLTVLYKFWCCCCCCCYVSIENEWNKLLKMSSADKKWMVCAERNWNDLAEDDDDCTYYYMQIGFFVLFNTQKNENWPIKFRRKTLALQTRPTRDRVLVDGYCLLLLVFEFKQPITMYASMIETLFDGKFSCRFHLELYTLPFTIEIERAKGRRDNQASICIILFVHHIHENDSILY